MTVKGYIFQTAALPSRNNLRATDGRQGDNGCLFVSNTKTEFCIMFLRACARNSLLDNVRSAFYVQSTVLHPSSLSGLTQNPFNFEQQPRELEKHPRLFCSVLT